MIVGGYKIVVQQPYQKISLSPKVMVSEKFRYEMNEYLAENFGYREVLEDGQVLKFMQTQTLVMNQTTFDRIKHKLNEPDPWERRFDSKRLEGVRSLNPLMG